VTYKVVNSPSFEIPNFTIDYLYGTVLYTSLLMFDTAELFVILEDDIIVSPDFYT